MCLKSDKVWSKKYVVFGFFDKLMTEVMLFIQSNFKWMNSWQLSAKRIEYCLITQYYFRFNWVDILSPCPLSEG